MNLLIPRGVTYARVNWGRWIADCASAHCRSALQLSPYQQWFQCWDCGEVAEIRWPPNPVGIEQLLLDRPDPFTRNWEWGETLHDLLQENLVHGILPGGRSLEGHPGGPLLTIVGDTITYESLPAPATLHQIEE
jgi:hypothetical protein